MSSLKYSISAWLLLFSLSLTAQTTNKPNAKSGAPKVATEYTNTLSFTIESEEGIKEVKMVSVKKGVKVLDYWDCATIDKVQENPAMKIDIRDQKNQQTEVSMNLPITNTGNVTATHQSNYDHLCDWNIWLHGNPNGVGDIDVDPAEITITITQWPSVGGYVEGTFSGTATLKKVMSTAYADVKEIPCTIKQGSFRIIRVEDQTGYGGE